MKSKTKMRTVAVIICVIVYAIYIAIATAAGWSQGGGILVIAILVGIMRAIWKAASEMGEEEDNKQLDAETPIPTEDLVEELVETPQIETDQIVETSTEELPPIPVEENTILPELPPIPQEEEKEIVENIEEKLPEVAQDKTPTTHWQKYKLYYIIGVCLSIVLAIVAPIAIHFHKQKQIDGLLSKAISACENTYFDLALQHLNEAYSLDKKNYATNYYIGCVQCHKHNYETARKYLERAYELNKKKQDCILTFDTIGYDRLLYYYYIALKDYEFSEEQSDINQRTLIAQEYITLYPNKCDAYRCMAYEYGLKNDFDKVEEYFDKILLLNPISTRLTDYMSDIYSQLKSMKYDTGSKEFFVQILFTEADSEWALEKYIKIRPDLEYIWKNYDNERTDQLFPLEWQSKKQGPQSPIENKTTTNQKQSVEKTKSKPSNVHNGHKFVDMGLSVKWATANIGANKPEECGDYFAWGEVQSKSSFTWTSYKWCNGSYNTLTKYNNNNLYGRVDDKIRLDITDDAAHAIWGGNWRMATREEQKELLKECIWTWTCLNGVNGYKITSKINENSIFLPAAGEIRGNEHYNVESVGAYWLATSLNSCDAADVLHFAEFFEPYLMPMWSRYVGCVIRPVCL